MPTDAASPLIRRADAHDVDRVAGLFRAVRRAHLSYLPDLRTYPRLRLWAFQKNAAAIRFYLARGFREIERTDGGRNEEREPDILFEWTR